MTLQKTDSSSNDLIKQFKKRKGAEYVEATRKRKADHSLGFDGKSKKFCFNGPSQSGFHGRQSSGFQGRSSFGSRGKDKGKPEFDKPDWKEVRAETKARKKKRKERSVGGEELFNSFMKAIKLWEELRHTECKKERRLELCRQVATLFIGNVKVIESLEDGLLPVIHTKDGSKIAMMCLWRGTAKQRKTIIKSFKGHMIEVSPGFGSSCRNDHVLE
ncbi:Armadillo-type fold [Trinorchestia longiramus]|nr:Armadillo-type fold [Trinorchestia longiramus]